MDGFAQSLAILRDMLLILVLCGVIAIGALALYSFTTNTAPDFTPSISCPDNQPDCLATPK